jgi:hypothetical protein
MNWINNELFIEKEIPKLNPLSYEYEEYWREQKRRCIEGYWVGGKWMPGNLYFYINFGTILLNKNNYSTAKTPGRAKLWDIFWELSNAWVEARGLTGFSGQQEVLDLKTFYDNESYNPEKQKELEGKIIPIRKILATSDRNLGKPLFLNEASDIMMMGNRGFGKSYYVADAIIAHEFLFDGLKEYTSETIKNPPSTEIVVGAGDAKYSSDILKKVKLCIDNLPGGVQLGDRYYPSPFSKQFRGSWNPGHEIEAKYKKKIGGTWQDIGTGSKIKHRTYGDNPFAAQGTRPAVAVKEEIGMFSNLIAAQEADVETMKSGTRKFGSCMYLGTGGDMDKGTIDALKMFYDPLTYNLLAFDDVWENKGKISYFSPATKGKIQYKDNQGNTREELALESELKEREKIKKGKNAATALDAYVQYNPLIPSEMFLVKKGNIFPVVEAMETLAKLEQEDRYSYNETIVDLYFDPDTKTGVNYKVDIHKKLKPITDFPLKPTTDRNGAVIIYEFPIEINGDVPKDMYLLGHDPYKNDDSAGESLGSIYVLKNKKYFKTHGHDEIVAEFIGRPDDGRKIINEILEKLWMFYGSPPRGIWFENAVGNTKEYFEKKKKLWALATQPETVLSKTGASTKAGNLIYGYPMSNVQIKAESETYTRDWFLEARGEKDNGDKVRNINLIKSRYLLKQIISYNRDGNFDGVMGFMGCVIGLEETHNQYVEQTKTQEEDILDFLNNKRKARING